MIDGFSYELETLKIAVKILTLALPVGRKKSYLAIQGKKCVLVLVVFHYNLFNCFD